MPYNVAMNQLTVVLPFALPPAELAGDLIRVLDTPALATLLSHNKCLQSTDFDSPSRVLPHESWLAHTLGLGDAQTANGVPLATAAMHGYNLTAPAQQGHWFIVQPSHLQLARTHLLLADARTLTLNEAESRALFDAARPSFEQSGGELLYAAPELWFWRADAWASLDTASPDAAVTQNVSDWMPEGDAARACRKLQNEVQMAWHEHPVNQAREMRGAPVMNACWVWAGASAMQRSLPPLAVAGGPDWLQALTEPDWRQPDVERLLAAPRPLIVPDLIQPAQAGEWSVWIDRLHAIEQQWLAPLLQGLRDGRIDQLELVLNDRERTLSSTSNRLALRKFWRKRTLNALIKQG